MDKQKTKKVETKKQVSAIEKIDNSSLKKNLIFLKKELISFRDMDETSPIFILLIVTARV